MTAIALLHGWGYGPETWDGLSGLLDAGRIAVLNAGYYGRRDLELPATNEPWVGIGHSLGFARLLMMDVPWKALVGVSAFMRFCATPEKPAGTPPAVLDAMITRLDSHPEDVLSRFQRRCGHAATCGGMPLAGGLARLREDLLLLRGLDLPAPRRSVPTLLIQAADDRIVSPELAQEAQALLPGSRLELLPGGGHALPMTRGPEIARLIREFLHGLG